MKAPDFSYEKPNSIPGILSLLEKDELECQLLAGGQSLMPMMNFRMATPKTIVDISGVSELSLITDTPKAIEIGAMVRYRELQDSDVIQKFCPLITMVIPHIAHPAIRNRGTIGGSIGLSDPAAELPAVLLALDGKVEVSSNKGIREEPANKFFKGVYETACSSNELITKIILPKAQPKQKFGFYEIARRHGDYAMAGVCIAQDQDFTVRVAFFGVAEKALRIASIEKVLSGNSIFSQSIIENAQSAVEDIQFEGDMNAGPEVKKHLAKVVLERALEEIE